MLVYGAGVAWSRLFLPGDGADPSRSEPESVPGTWPSGAAQKSGGFATLEKNAWILLKNLNVLTISKTNQFKIGEKTQLSVLKVSITANSSYIR